MTFMGNEGDNKVKLFSEVQNLDQALSKLGLTEKEYQDY